MGDAPSKTGQDPGSPVGGHETADMSRAAFRHVLVIPTVMCVERTDGLGRDGSVADPCLQVVHCVAQERVPQDLDTAVALDRAATAANEAVKAFDAHSHAVPPSLRAAAATDVRLVPSLDLTRALILAGVDAPSPARWIDLAIGVAESFAALRPFATWVGIAGLGAPRASWAAVKRRGELLLWAGIARSLRGDHQLAVERLIDAAATFDSLSNGDGSDPATIGPLRGRAREEAAGAALAGGSRDAADELFRQAAMVYAADGDETRAAAVERRRAVLSTGVLPTSGFLERSGTATSTVLGTSSAVDLRQRARDDQLPEATTPAR